LKTAKLPETEIHSLLPVSIIILNYNGKKHLETCLDSVFKSSYSNFEVILVDNCSNDDSVDFIKEKYGDKFNLKIVVNSENLGFAEGNNVGAKHAKNDLLVFLNNDTEVHPDWLKELVKTAVSNPSLGICLCRVVTEGLRQDLIGNVDRYGRAVLMRQENFKMNGGEVIASGPVFLIRRDTFNRIDGFDSRYFIYFEDIDLAWRAKLLGYKILLQQNSIVFHKVAGTTKRYGLSRRRYFLYRNTLRTLIKNYSFSTFWRLFPISLMLIIIESVAILLTVRDPYLPMAVIRAILWNITNLNDTLILRKQIQNTRVIDDKEILRIMAPFNFLHRIV